MSSLKAVLVQDYAGNNLLSVLDGTRTDPHLISGMLSALDSFSKEVIGGSLRKFEVDNGINLLFSKFFFSKEISRDWLTYDHGFPFTEELMRDGVSDDYFLLDSVPSGVNLGRKCFFVEDLKSLGFTKKTVRVFDYEKKDVPLFVLHYKPEVKYSVSIKEELTNGVYFSIVYDSRDDGLVLPGGDCFVNSCFNDLGVLVKSHVQQLGHVVENNNYGFLSDNLLVKVRDFFNEYNKKRDELMGPRLFNEVPACIKELSNASLTNEMKLKLSELKSIFNK